MSAGLTEKILLEPYRHVWRSILSLYQSGGNFTELEVIHSANSEVPLEFWTQARQDWLTPEAPQVSGLVKSLQKEHQLSEAERIANKICALRRDDPERLLQELPNASLALAKTYQMASGKTSDPSQLYLRGSSTEPFGSTGLRALDALLQGPSEYGGWRYADLAFIYAMIGQGKTTAIITFAVYAMLQNLRFCIVTCEQSIEVLSRLLLRGQVGDRLTPAQLDDPDYMNDVKVEALYRMRDYGSIFEIEGKVSEIDLIASVHQPHLIFVDPYENLMASGGQDTWRNDLRVSQELRTIASRRRCAIVCTMQLSGHQRKEMEQEHELKGEPIGHGSRAPFMKALVAMVVGKHWDLPMTAHGVVKKFSLGGPNGGGQVNWPFDVAYSYQQGIFYDLDV